MRSVDNGTLRQVNAHAIEKAYQATTGRDIPSSSARKIIIDKTFEHLDRCYSCRAKVTLASGLNEETIKQAVAHIWGPLDLDHPGGCVIA